MKIFSSLSGFRVIASTALLTLSVFLGVGHAERIQNLRENALPLAATLPSLEERLRILTEQVELSEMAKATSQGSALERLHVFVIPKEQVVGRTVALLDILRETLKEDLRHMSPIEFGESKKASIDGLTVHPLTVDVTLTENGLSTFSDFLDLAGFLTVGDTIPSVEYRLLIEATEAENPAGLVSLEEFLSTDLFTYARDPKGSDDKLMKAFSSDHFISILQTMVASEELTKAKKLFQSPLGEALERDRLWPLRFLTISDVLMETLPDGAVRLKIELDAYTRE